MGFVYNMCLKKENYSSMACKTIRKEGHPRWLCILRRKINIMNRRLDYFLKPLILRKLVHKLHNRKREYDTLNERDWSQLPSNILDSIMEHLCFMDQVRFRAVCKNWRAIDGIKPNDKFPWLLIYTGMKYRFPERKYYFYNPSTKKVYSVKNDVKHACTSYPYKSCHAVRLGWFLLQFWCCGDLILYNAFTCEVINLPKVIPSEEFKFMTFYYCPKRRHFEVYGVHKAGKDDHQSAEGMKISISMWSSTSASGNNKGWETHTFKLEEDMTDFDVKFFKAECVKGTELYCVFTNGTVGVFNACNKKWRVVVKSRWEILDLTYPDLVEFEEELFLVHQGPYEWPIFKLDLSKKTWVEEADNLGDRALFSSRHSLCSSQFMILNPKLMKENLEGYVYYDYVGSNSDYSVSFKRLNLAKSSGDSDKWELKWPRQVLRGCPRHCWIHLCAIWIQPPPI